MQSKRYIHFNQELQITAGHVLMSDYNLLMSVGIRPEIGYDDCTNHKTKTVILRLKICTIITVWLLESGQLEEDYQITTVFENKRFSSYFLIHNFEGCFLWSQVSSNSFKVFNGCVVEPWILLVGLLKNLGIFCFQKTFWFVNLLPTAPVW